MAGSPLPGHLAQLERIGQAPRKGLDASVKKGAAAAKKRIEREIAAVAPSMRLRNVGKRGAKIGVRYTVRGGNAPTAFVKAIGPIQIIERDTKAHGIAPKKRRARAAGGRAAILTPDGPRVSARHPGTKGKHPFEKGANAAVPLVGAEMSKTMINAVKAAL